MHTSTHAARRYAAPFAIVAAMLLALSGSQLASASANRSANRSAHVTPATASQPAQFGIDVDFRGLTADTPEEMQAQVAHIVAYAKSLHSNAIVFSFPYTMPSPNASVVANEAETPSMAQLKAGIADARAAGLAVTLRPYLDQTSLKAFGNQYWSGVIHPAHLPQWFASLTRLLTPYLALARHSGVGTFVVGSEFNSLSNSKYWPPLLATAARIYHGHLSYADNWDQYAANVVGVPVKNVGLDAYPPQLVRNGASVQQLTNGWLGWFDHAKSALRSRTTIYEVGIVATAGAYRLPYAWSLKGAYSAATQRNWFMAACLGARKALVPGIFYWGIASDQTFTPQGANNRGSFFGRSAQSALKTCFTKVY
jgi:hypothetical protein